MDKNKVQKIYSRNIPKIPKIKYLKMNNDNNIDKNQAGVKNEDEF